MRYFALALLLLLAGCYSSSSRMTRTTFDNIQMGEPINQLQAQIGEPNSVYSIGMNAYEYEYIEKIDFQYGYVVENHYFLTISDGKIVGKRYSQERSPAYDLIYQADPNYPGYPNHPTGGY